MFNMRINIQKISNIKILISIFLTSIHKTDLYRISTQKAYMGNISNVSSPAHPVYRVHQCIQEIYKKSVAVPLKTPIKPPKQFKPIVTYTLILANTLMLTIGILNPIFTEKYILNCNPKYGFLKEWYKFFTSGFIHVGFLHFLCSVFMLYKYGIPVEKDHFDKYKGFKGNFLYSLLYLGGVIFSNICYTLYNKGKNINICGASSGIYALLAKLALTSPKNSNKKVSSFLKLIMLATLIIVFDFLELVLIREVATIAHLGGFLFGIIYSIVFFPKSPPQNLQNLKQI